MKQKCTHLPPEKQAELQLVTDTICKNSDLYMVILFGSYARGDYVEDKYIEGHITYEYQSDYDILVVTKAPSKKAHNIAANLQEYVRAEVSITTPVSIISHSIQFLNKKIDSSEYFFSDIKKEGCMLYDSGEVKLAKFRKLRNSERAHLAREDYEYWFDQATEFLDLFDYCVHKKNYTFGSFQLHQAAESLYVTALLVYTHYKPKVHNLEKLAGYIAAVDKGFINAIPNVTPTEKHHFELLRDAYIDARYKKGFRVSKEELLYMGEKVKAFCDLVEKLCLVKIREFEEKFEG